MDRWHEVTLTIWPISGPEVPEAVIGCLMQRISMGRMGARGDRISLSQIASGAGRLTADGSGLRRKILLHYITSIGIVVRWFNTRDY